MGVLWILGLLLGVPLLAWLVFLALSSCLGDEFRAYFAGFPVNPRSAVYDRNYLRTMTNSGSAMSEQIELDDMVISGPGQYERHQDLR
ncbi:hypothetical protein AJ80_03901 [Polytolypa hystricis UAMH7299]|uniref:Uncharacterized protein n=1 Tax=Polytolypa hystricis (strain UAMH7299) TaxID=1447883 RepID=A0A2B7YE62_POLH7|nr:hypothetical protein AJ80_03901 [Polytolypa hystricis UAMH7299]